MENTEKVDRHSVLSRFITRSIKDLYERFNTISEEESETVKDFIAKIEGRVELDIYEDYDTIKALSNKLNNVDSLGAIKLYVFLTKELGLELEVEELRSYHQDLENKGYILIDQKHLLYFDYGEESLEMLAEERLIEDLEDSDRVVELFDEEEIANMWVFQTSPRIAAKQYLLDNSWQEFLEISELSTAYRDEFDCEVFYAYNNGCELE